MDKRSSIERLGKTQYIALVILFCITVVFMASAASAQEDKKERGYNGRITIKELLSKFKRGEIVTGYIIDGNDLIKIIRRTRYAIKIEDSIIKDGLDFQKLQKIPLDKIKLPKDWDEKQRDGFIKKTQTFYYPNIYNVKSEIQIINSEIQSKKKDVPSVQASFTIFYDTVDFSKTTFSGDATFSNATFSGDAYFTNATFSGDATFSNATFGGSAYFLNATFSGHAHFLNATFSGYTTFSKATFSGYAHFSNATFSADARFSNATFSGYATFSKATFSGNAHFSNATFSAEVDFSKATFSETEAFFFYIFHVKRVANFANATFSGVAIFSNAIFCRVAIFSNATFSKEADFSKATFSEEASFSNATFHELVYFKESRVNHLLLDATLFIKYADFREMIIEKLNWKCTSPAIVKGRIDFRNSRISEMHFQDIIFENDVDFSDVEFGVPLEISGPLKKGKTDGKLATVFRFVTFESDAYFIRAKFHDDTAFERIRFKGDANFTDIDFKDFKLGDTKKFSLSYLTFKHLLLSMDDLPNILNWVREDRDRIQSFKDVEEIIEWLNELLSIPRFCDVFIEVKPEGKIPDSIIKLAEKTESYRKKDFKSFREYEINSIKKLNRLIFEVPYPQKTSKESLQPLTKILNNLEEVFHSQNNLNDANLAYYYRKLMELEDTRQMKHVDTSKISTFLRRVWSVLEWYSWGKPCGYATSWKKIVLWCGGLYLFFVILYSTGGKLTKTFQEEEDELRLRIFVLPKKYLFHESEGNFVPNEYLIDHTEGWGKFISALKFSMVVFFKIGYIDTKISGKILRGDVKYFVWVEWVIGYWFLFALVTTLSRTLPMVHRLISGIF